VKGETKMIHARKDYDPIQDPRGKIAEDEPVILFRAKDKHMPLILDIYANLVANDREADAAIIQSVRQHAGRARAWQMSNIVHAPDMNPEDNRYGH
jgi:hypothetical protein